MNKKGFTLVELLAVIALLALLAGLAVPNILSTINNNKRRTFLMDAERMVTKAEYLLSINKEHRNKLLAEEVDAIIYDLNTTYKLDGSKQEKLIQVGLNEKGEFELDADGGSYTSASVSVTYENNTYKYCIQVIGSKRTIGKSACIDSESLTGIDVVEDK